MSTWHTWHEIPDGDIDIDYASSKVNLLINSDDLGNNYVTLTWEQVEKLHNQIFVKQVKNASFEQNPKG